MFIKIKDSVINSDVIALVTPAGNDLCPLIDIFSVAGTRLCYSYLNATDDCYIISYESIKERDDDLNRINNILLG